MSDNNQIITMLGTIITMLTGMENTINRYDDIMKRVKSHHTKEDEEMLEAVRVWQEDCARDEYESGMSSSSEKPKKRKVKKIRDPEHPKRGLSAYLLWCADNRLTVKAMLDGKPDGGEKHSLSKTLGEMWKSTEDHVKSKYKAQAKSDMDRYHAEMEAYNAKKGIVKHKAGKMDISPDTEAHAVFPDGWSGPIDGFLAKHPRDPETGKRIMRSFESFEEAFAEAERLGSACGGITLTTNAKGTRRLTLREANSVTFNSEWNAITHEISYLAPH